FSLSFFIYVMYSHPIFRSFIFFFFFFNHTPPTDTYTLSLHDALPICPPGYRPQFGLGLAHRLRVADAILHAIEGGDGRPATHRQDRKSTRLNSSHVKISYAVFCLKKKKKKKNKYHSS